MYRRLLLAASMLSTGLLFAAEPVPSAEAPDYATWSLKGRFLAGLANVDGVENGIDLGVNFATPVGMGLVNLEADYEQLFGSNYNAPILPNNLGLTGNNAFDTRKHAVTGLVVRLGYQRTLSDDWTWQLGVAGTLYKVEIHSNDQFGYSGAAGSWDQTIVQRQHALSPYGGVRWEVNAASAFEFNLRMVSYKEATIYPVYGTYAITSAYGSRSVFTPKLELGYVYKF